MSHNIQGIPITNLISPTENTLSGGNPPEKINERIATLSVPTGLATITHEKPIHKIVFKSSTTSFTYKTIPESLYDTLIDLVSVKPKSTSRKSRAFPKRTQNHKTKKNTQNLEKND
jgi:hypothetical protein